MLDLETRLRTLKRPTLLARAARFGIDDYRREVHLPRILRSDALPRHGQALIALLEIEEEMNAQRLARSGEYRLAQHVAILIALAGEARLMRASATRLMLV